MMKKTPRAGQSNLPVPKTSKFSPGNAKSSLSKTGAARSAEDIPRKVQLSLSGTPASPQRRAISPGTPQRRSMIPSPVPGQNGPGHGGVRYITEDLIRKMCKEDSLEMVTTLNLTLTRSEAGKKIKYIENLDRMKRLQVLILSNNIIEKIERVDKLLKLKELDLSYNCIVKIEGLENLSNLQILNLSGNLIEHIPIWISKRLKSLRAFYLAKNRLESLSELAKLKPLPDLTQITVAENPLAEFNHCRPYLIFHLRTLEVIDGQQVNDRERNTAKDRFELDEVERLEKQLESEEARFRRLEEDHNRSKQERSHLSATEDDLRKRERTQGARIMELEREMETKNDLLKKKTSELNKACEKHYQLEQELAFYKIDNKFDSLGRGPQQHALDESGEDSGLLGESPYIGRARYKANRFAGESEVLSASPSQAQLHSIPSPQRAEVKMELNQKLDKELAMKKDRVAKAEDRLKRLTSELQMTEDKLREATKDLKHIGDHATHDKEEFKQQIRQKMARKMRTVNEMKDSATQIEEEIDKTKTSLHKHKMEMNKLRDQLSRMDQNDPNYRRMYAEMVDKEQQISESNQMYGQLQDQLELMLDTIAKETNDIKSLEQKLNEDSIENNESLREELDDIVGGLQTYLAQVQTKAAKKEREFDVLLKENEDLHDKLRKTENELSLVDQEASGLRDLERRYADMELSFRQAEDRNRDLQDQVHRSQRHDTNLQDTIESKDLENASLKKALKDLEQKSKVFSKKSVDCVLDMNPGKYSNKKSANKIPDFAGIIPYDQLEKILPSHDKFEKTPRAFKAIEKAPAADDTVEKAPGYFPTAIAGNKDAIHQERKAFENHMKAVENERRDLEMQFRAADNQYKSIESSFGTQSKTLEMEKMSAEKRCKLLEADLITAEKRCRELEDRNIAYEQRNSEIGLEKNSAEKRCRDLESELEQLEQQFTSLEQRGKDCSTEKTAAEKRVKQLEAEKRIVEEQFKAAQKIFQVEMEKAERHTLEKALQTEKAKAIEGDRKSKEAQKKEDEVRKLLSQLETVKAQNAALKDRVEQENQTFQTKLQDMVPNSELRRRLKDLTQTFKQNKVSIEPESDRDVLGKSFRDLQGFVHDKLNKSTQDADQTRNKLDKSDMENMSLREQLKNLQDKLSKREEKVKNEKNKSKAEKKADAEEIKRLNDENNRLKNALKEAKNRAKQKHTKMVNEPDTESVFSRRSSMNSEEKHLFDELQNELMSLKRLMRNREDDANRKIVDAETEAAMLEQNLHDKEESYQREIERLRDHMDMQRDRQEARMQVIASDLDQAQQVADFLQRALDEREQQLHGEVQQTDMNNQMITTQEDELSKLYDILETQREEIDRLNGMLDTISGQGGTLAPVRKIKPSVGTAGADEELWRLRQEVNNLKETLAMQSAYVQTMPPPSNTAGVQASTGTGTQYYLTDQGQASGPTYRPLLSQYRDQQLSLVPPGKGQASMGTSYGPPGYGVGMPQSVGVGGSAGFGTGTGMAAGGSPIEGHGTGATTPPGGQPAGRSRPRQSSLRRHADRGVDIEGDGVSERSHGGRSGRSSRSRRRERGRDSAGRHGKSDRHSNRGHEKGHRHGDSDRESERHRSRRARSLEATDRKGAFEPLHRPEPHRPQNLAASGPMGVYSTQGGMMQSQPMGGTMTGPGGQMMGQPGMVGPGGQAVGPGMMTTGPVSMGQGSVPLQQSGVPFAAGNTQAVPMGPGSSAFQGSGMSPTRGGEFVSGPSFYPGGAPHGSILKHPGLQANSGPPGTAPQGYMIPPGYNIPPHPGAVGAGTGATQTPGYSATQTAGGGSGAQQQAAAPPGFAPLPTDPLGPSVALGQTPGVQQGGSAFTAPAQALAYNSGRVFLPAYPTSPSKPTGRVYYSKGSGGRYGGGGGGGDPGQPPAGPAYFERDHSPERSMRFLPMEPLAQGTPIAGHTMARTGGGNVALPSPIRPAVRDQSPRRMAAPAATGADDTYLFCNVPEHHDLEDYIAELQEKLRKLKARIANEKELQEEIQDNNEYNLIRRLQGELGERRDELEGLDLAIERQQKNLKNLKAEERRLQFEREAARDELEFIKDQNVKKRRKTRTYPDDEDSFDERMENSRKKMLKDEIKCLEQTLAKRKAQLREADRLLKECNTDLKCAREEARETVREFDKATVGLESTVKETSELEKRANIAGIELIKATEKLTSLRREIQANESKRGKSDRLLREVTSLISKRDAEFKDLDSRSKATQQNLSRLTQELSAATQKERDMVQALRDSEDVLAKRRNEIARMRDQIDQQKQELEKVDHQMGKKRTELQFLTENLDRKQGEINQLIRDTETELSSNKREIKEQRDLLRNMEVQKSDLSTQVKVKRQELQKIKDEIDTDDEILQKLVNSVSKHKSDLKHTFEMQRMEQTELDNLKSQHAQKLAELEKTQRELLDEKNALEQLNSDVNKKATELDRLRNLVERDREDVERLSMEKQSYEDRISTMSREKEMLDENLKTLDTKIVHMRRSQATMEDKIDSTSRRLETLEQELQRREREMDDLSRDKAHMQKDANNLKNTIKDGKNELKSLKEHIKDAENSINLLEQQLRDTNVQRDEAKLEMERLNEGIRQSRITHDDCIRQQRQREEELQDLIRTMDEREIEYQETRKSLNKVRKEVEKEENKLQKLVSTANYELDHIRTDLNTKQTELGQATADIMNLKKEAEKMELDEKKLTECEQRIRELKQEVQDRNEEKNELAKALTRSYEELQKLRTESAQEQERLTIDRMTLENTLKDMQEQMEHAKKEMQQMQKRSSSQMVELQSLAEEQFNRANKATDELARVKSRKATDQSQDTTLSDVTNQNTVSDSANQNTVSDRHGDKSPVTTEQPDTINLTTKQNKNGTQLRDKGQYPRRSLPEISKPTGSGFRDYLNLESPTSLSQTSGFQLQSESHEARNQENSQMLLDTSLTWPTSPDASFLVSGSPITGGSPARGSPVRFMDREPEAKNRDRSISPHYSRGRGQRPSSAILRTRSPSPYKDRDGHTRSSSARGRDRSWSPPSFRDQTFPSLTRDADSFSLPDTRNIRDHYRDISELELPKMSKSFTNKASTAIPVSTITANLTDTSSTLSTLTSTPNTQRDSATPRDIVTSKSDPMTLTYGRVSSSPPVRDSGSSLTTVTTITDQQQSSSSGRNSARDSGRESGQTTARDRHLTFDLGFLDILTIDSNSSIVDQLSTGRTTDRLLEDKENVRAEQLEEQRKADMIIREKLSKEQELLRLQLQQQMQRHADAMEQARLQSEGNIENLRKKLNTLQDVLVTTADVTSPTLRHARSRSAGLIASPERQRSPSPGMRRHGYLAQRPRSRSRSADRLNTAFYPDREFLTV